MTVALVAKPPPKLRRPAILLAGDEDAPMVRELVTRQYPYLDALDWTKIAPWWLIAVQDERIVGALQIGASLPIGRIEYLCISPALRHADRARAAFHLMHTALGYLRRLGCSMAQGIIGKPYSDNWTERLLKRGGVVVVSGDMVARRLR